MNRNDSQKLASGFLPRAIDISGVEQTRDTTRLANQVENARNQNTPSDTDKMEWFSKLNGLLLDVIDGKEGSAVRVRKLFNLELQKAADSARVKVVEELREKVELLSKDFREENGGHRISTQRVMDILKEEL